MDLVLDMDKPFSKLLDPKIIEHFEHIEKKVKEGSIEYHCLFDPKTSKFGVYDVVYSCTLREGPRLVFNVMFAGEKVIAGSYKERVQDMWDALRKEVGMKRQNKREEEMNHIKEVLSSI